MRLPLPELLRQRPDFRRLFVGAALVQLGRAFTYLALMSKFVELAGSSSGWGYLLALEVLPFALLGPLIGLIVDHLDRGRVFVGSCIGRALCLVAIAHCGDLVSLYVMVVVASVFQAFYRPAHKALVASLLEPAELLKANALDEAARGAATMIGMGAAAWCLHTWSATVCFYLDAAAYLVAGVAVSRVRVASAASASDLRAGLAHLGGSLRETVSLVRTRPGLRLPVALALGCAVVLGFEFPLFFPLVDEKGWGGAAEVGYLYMASAAGALATGLMLTRYAFSPLRQPLVLAGVLLIDTLAVAVLAWSGAVQGAIAACVILGLTDTLTTTYWVSQMQYHAPQAYQGRVFAGIEMLRNPLFNVCIALSGLCVSWTSATTSVAVAAGIEGAMCVAVAILGLRAWSSRTQARQ